MHSDVAIRVHELSKTYRIFDSPRQRLQHWFSLVRQKIFGGKNSGRGHEFHALRNISFEIAKGQTVGIIGRNGSGKSTLLQLICGTLTPTMGSIQAQGRITALLELGAGFNPDFTGRENIYLNAEILGLKRSEIENKLAEIIQFADIGDHLDQPVKTYSSGMYVRLAFAVQACIDPDILVVDEALAVGDAKFQAKCFDHLRRLKASGTSILLVTHSHEQIVMHCDHAILLNRGEMLASGTPRHVVNQYLDLLFGGDSTSDENKGTPSAPDTAPTGDAGAHQLHNQADSEAFSSHPTYNPGEYRWGDGRARILDFEVCCTDKLYPSHIPPGEKVRIKVKVRYLKTVHEPIIGFSLKSKEGVVLFSCNTEMNMDFPARAHGQAGSESEYEVNFDFMLGVGDYFLSLGVASREGAEVIPHDRRYDAIHLTGLPAHHFHGIVDLKGKISATLGH